MCSGVSGGGLSTTVFPAARAGASFIAATNRGAFQGTIAQTTPTGTRRTCSLRPAEPGRVADHPKVAPISAHARNVVTALAI